MNETRFPWPTLGIGAIVLAVLAAVVGVRSGNKEAPRSEQAQAENKPDVLLDDSSLDQVDDPARKALIKLLDNHKPDPPAQSKRPPGLRTFDDSDRQRVKTLIVTVPDPIDTPFSYWFDEYVDCLTRAASQFAYAPAGHWFPWHPSQRSKPPGDAEAQARKSPRFLDQPGILLFRKRDEQDATFTILAILLVSDTPVSVRPEPFRQALRLSTELGRGSPGQKIYLLGPNFTGSLPSLKVTLQLWQKESGLKAADFAIISPSANGLAIDAVQTEPKVQTLFPPSEFVQNAALQFLKRHGAGRSVGRDRELYSRNSHFFRDVAILTESNTGFGAHVSGAGDRHLESKKEILKVPDPDQVLVLTYPMFLSRLSAKYTLERQQQDKQLGD